MVMDFADVKAIARRELVDQWDHAFLVYEGDQAVREFLQTLPQHKTVVMPRVPTAENMAAEAFRLLDACYCDRFGNHVRLQRVRLYETPTSWADALRDQD
jgi:6-pyruvoyltetrahydropterin/6-carboxytetrahydropterin synthase